MGKYNYDLLLEEIELKLGKRRYEILPQLFFIFGLAFGFLLNITANILYDSFIKGDKVSQIIVLVISAVCFFLISHWINQFYLKPIRGIEEEINKLKKLINNSV